VAPLKRMNATIFIFDARHNFEDKFRNTSSQHSVGNIKDP